MILGFSVPLALVACSSDNDADGEGSVAKSVDYTITGIEPGAGLTGLAHNALDDYDNLSDWDLLESSTGSMLTSLKEAIANEEPIVITAWDPHWMFEEFDLKTLEDPKNSFGDAEDINTIARLDLENDMPEAYQILDNFHWEVEDMNKVMYEAESSSFEEAASDWIEENQDKIDDWTEGLEKVDGDAIEIVSTPWDSERASSEIINQVLTEQGYNVTVSDVDPAVVFESIANGKADASLAPWLPTTHGPFMEKHEGKIEDLGSNLEGTQNSLAVPTYMDVDSIEDLK